MDGSPTKNAFLMQFCADVFGKSVVTNRVEGLSAPGTAYACGLATGFWKDRREPEALCRIDQAFNKRCPGVRQTHLFLRYILKHLNPNPNKPVFKVRGSDFAFILMVRT